MKQPSMKPWVKIWYFPGTNSEGEVAAAYELAGFKVEIVFVEKFLSGQVLVKDCDCAHLPGGFAGKDAVRAGAVPAAIAQDILPQLKEFLIPTCFECNGFQIGMEGGCFGDGLALDTNKIGTFVSQPTKHLLLPSNCIYTDNLYHELKAKGREAMLEFPSAHGIGQLIGSKLDQAKVVMVYKGHSPNGGKIAGITEELGIFFGHMDHWNRPYDNPDGQLVLANLKRHL